MEGGTWDAPRLCIDKTPQSPICIGLTSVKSHPFISILHIDFTMRATCIKNVNKDQIDCHEINTQSLEITVQTEVLVKKILK